VNFKFLICFIVCLNLNSNNLPDLWKKIPKKPTTPNINPTIVIKKFSSVETNNSIKNIELNSQIANFYKKNNLMILKNFTAKKFSNEKVSTTIIGKNAFFNTKSKNIFIPEISEVLLPNNLKIKAKDTWYLDKKSVFLTTKRITGTGGQNFSLDFYANKFHHNIKDSFSTLQGNTKLKFKDNKTQQKINISGNTITLKALKNEIEVFGKCVIGSSTINAQGEYCKISLKTINNSFYLNKIAIKSIKKPTKTKANKFNLTSKNLKLTFNKNNSPNEISADGGIRLRLLDGTSIAASSVLLSGSKKNPNYFFNKNVKITQNDRNASADSAQYVSSDDKYILTGNVQISDANNLIKGDEVEYFISKQIVNVKKAQGIIDGVVFEKEL